MAEGESALVELVKTRLREFWRERGIIFWVFGFPILMAVGLGLAFRSRPLELSRVAVVASERSTEVTALLESERVEAALMDEASARRSLGRAKVDAIVKWQGGQPTYLLDPMQEGGARARLVADEVLERAAGRKNVLQAKEEAVSERGSRYIDFLLPGLIGLNLMGSSMWGVGYNLVVARKRRLLRRYAVTPMRRSHFLLSYFFSRSFFLVIELAFLLAFGALVFDTTVQGSYVAFTLVAFVGAASFAGISLLIGARVENMESANGWMNFVQLPMWVLSGAFFSYERFPEWLHAPIRLLPLTALVDGLRAIFNDAAGLLSTWPQILVLAVWGAAGFAVALKTFRWQ
ncbi:MAG TPA: ABC transporter permease [Polyangiaceae bacterium]|jgi:ABC-type multidrug transport system permease subunit